MGSALMNALPRGPVFTGKSERQDVSDGYTRSLLDWREAAREDAIETLRLNPEFDQVQDYIDKLEGRWWDRGYPQHRSRFVDNRLSDARIESLSLLTDVHPTIDVSTSQKVYGQHAEIVRNVILHEWRRLRLDLKLLSVVDHALFSTGYWKIGATMPGAFVITPCGMDTVLPIQLGADFQESAGVLYRTYKGLNYFQRIWGEKADGLEREQSSSTWTGGDSNSDYRPGHIPEFTWNSLSPAMRRHFSLKAPRARTNDASPFPSIPLEEYWVDSPETNDSPNQVLVCDPNLTLQEHNYWYRVDPGQRLFPRKRLIVFAGDRVMYDGPSPYWHGLYPFARLALNPVTWAPGGLSKYRNMVPVNKLMCEIGAGLGDIIKRTLKPTVVTKDGAVKDSVWKAFFPDVPGMKLKMTPVASVSDVRYIEPPSLPAITLPYLSYLQQAFDRHAGTLDATALGKKKQVPGGDTIEQMRDSMQSAFRLESRFVEAFLGDAGVQAISNVFQYFTREQRMRILGADGQTYEDFDFNPESMVPWSAPREDHWRNFAFEVSQGSLHGASKDRLKQTAMALFKMKAIGQRALLRILEMPDADRIMAEFQEEQGAQQQALAAMAAAKGGGRNPRMTRGQKNGKVV